MTDNTHVRQDLEQARAEIAALTDEEIAAYLSAKLETFVASGIPRDRVGGVLVNQAIVYLVTQHGYAATADMLAEFAAEVRRSPLPRRRLDLRFERALADADDGAKATRLRIMIEARRARIREIQWQAKIAR